MLKSFSTVEHTSYSMQKLAILATACLNERTKNRGCRRNISATQRSSSPTVHLHIKPGTPQPKMPLGFFKY